MALTILPEDGSRPILMISQLSDEEILEPGLSKLDREQLQFEAFSAAVPAYQGATATHGNDPPDLLVSQIDRTVGLEITQLSVSNLRSDVAHLSEISRILRDSVDVNGAEYAHLSGRTVRVAVHSIPTRREIPGLVREVAQVLLVDVGYMWEGVDLSGGFPDSIKEMKGLHKSVAGAPIVSVERAKDGEFDVRANLSGGLLVPIAEIEAAVIDLIATKDRPENDVLVISTGMPDYNGLTFPADVYLFEALREFELPGENAPQHLDEVYLHHWPSHDYRMLFGGARD